MTTCDPDEGPESAPDPTFNTWPEEAPFPLWPMPFPAPLVEDLLHLAAFHLLAHLVTLDGGQLSHKQSSRTGTVVANHHVPFELFSYGVRFVFCDPIDIRL